MRTTGAILITLGLAMPAVALAQSAPGWQQTLGGMLTGNQNQDNALREAYQRGYQRGRNDEAQALQANNQGYGKHYGDRYNGPRDEQPYQQQYTR